MSATSDTRGDSAVREIAYVAVFAALIVALTLFPAIEIGISPVPITLQTFAVALAAMLLGARRGALTVLTYLALIAIGLPVAAGYVGGLGVLAGPTGGFLVGFVPQALVVGAVATWATRRSVSAPRPPSFRRAVAPAPPLPLPRAAASRRAAPTAARPNESVDGPPAPTLHRCLPWTWTARRAQPRRPPARLCLAPAEARGGTTVVPLFAPPPPRPIVLALPPVVATPRRSGTSGCAHRRRATPTSQPTSTD